MSPSCATVFVRQAGNASHAKGRTDVTRDDKGGMVTGRRAHMAYRKGQMPRSRWTKAAMLDAIGAWLGAHYRVLDDRDGVMGMGKDELWERFFTVRSWCLTSACRNRTALYGVDADRLSGASHLAPWHVRATVMAQEYERDCDDAAFLAQAQRTDLAFVREHGYAPDSVRAYAACYPDRVRCEERAERRYMSRCGDGGDRVARIRVRSRNNAYVLYSRVRDGESYEDARDRALCERVPFQWSVRDATVRAPADKPPKPKPSRGKPAAPTRGQAQPPFKVPTCKPMGRQASAKGGKHGSGALPIDRRFVQSGYCGKSMSKRARRAYDHGQMPRSRWTKAAMWQAMDSWLADNCRMVGDDVRRLGKAELWERFFVRKSWHHTSACMNRTEFYGIDQAAMMEASSPRPDWYTKAMSAIREYDAQCDDAAAMAAKQRRELPFVASHGYAPDSVRAYTGAHPDRVTFRRKVATDGHGTQRMQVCVTIRTKNNRHVIHVPARAGERYCDAAARAFRERLPFAWNALVPGIGEATRR